jgi:tRNA A-37 threonylcarbamoyl transferase component Bud32/tetratricopeptide (TPR) repeat protein
MTDEKADKFKSTENVHETDPPGYVGEDTTIVLRETDEDQQSDKQVKPAGRALGTIIGGHYRLESRIGSGGSSAVYLATDLSLNRKVAVKLLLSGAYFSDEERLRFQREGRAVGSLDHPHVVRVFEFNTTENDEPFLVMEYLQGQSLADIVKERGAIPVEEVIAWITQVVQGLSYAHKRGIVHRDVKSSNIVIVQNADGESIAKVVDFGLARPEDEAGKGLTLTGTIFGSPHYMSPEQCRGERVDVRSDIYSLGCVMYECLNGQVPFAGASILETFRQHLEDQPKPFAARLKSTGNAADIEKVVFKCLSKNPSDRYQDADRLEQDLKALGKNSRSSMWANAASQGRIVRAGASGVFSKYGKSLVAVAAIVTAFLCVLLLRPQIFTDAFDNYWNSLDLKAQQAFDTGDYKTAAEEYKKALEFATYAPLTKRELRIKESALGQLDLATLLEDKKGIEKWTSELNAVRKLIPEAPGMTFSSMPGLLGQLKELKVSVDKEGKNTKENSKDGTKNATTRSASGILNRANDAAEVMIEDGRCIDAGNFLEAAYLGTADYLPEDDPVVPRSLLNLVSFKINTDPLKSFVYLNRCHNLMKDQSKSLPPLARAHFLADLGRCYLLALQPELATEPLEEAVEIYRYQGWLTGAGAGTAYLRLAEAQIRMGHPHEAISSLEQAEVAFNTGEKPSPGSVLRCALTHAEILMKTGKVKEGMQILEQQLLKQEKTFPKRYSDLTETIYWYARLMVCLPATELTEARAKYLGSRVCAIWERMQEYAFASHIWMALGKYHGEIRKLVDGERFYLRALDNFHRMKSADYFSIVSLNSNLAEMYMRRNDYKKAYDFLKIAERTQAKAKVAQIGSIIGTSHTTEKFLYERLAETTDKLGLREENKKYRGLVDSAF